MKRFVTCRGKSYSGILSLIFLILFANLITPKNPLHAQPYPEITFDRSNDSILLDSLRDNFGEKKRIPQEVELQALRALSHFPELKEIQIEFRYVKSKTAHSSQPKISSIFRNGRNRAYLIKISTQLPSFFYLGMQSNLPYNAQIGVLGHELSHTAQYITKRSFGLIAMGIRYSCSRREVRSIEQKTDESTIHHNLGWQLLAWQKIARPLLNAAGRGQNYLTPSEIEALLKN